MTWVDGDYQPPSIGNLVHFVLIANFYLGIDKVIVKNAFVWECPNVSACFYILISILLHSSFWFLLSKT